MLPETNHEYCEIQIFFIIQCHYVSATKKTENKVDVGNTLFFVKA